MSAATERPHLIIIMNNLLKVVPQQVTQSEIPGRPDVGGDRKTAPDYYLNNLLKVVPQQVTQSEMITMHGFLKIGKLILRCANDRGDPM